MRRISEHTKWLKGGRLTSVTPEVLKLADQFPEILGKRETAKADLSTVASIATYLSRALGRFNLARPISSEHRQVEREANRIIARTQKEQLYPYKHRLELQRAVPWRRNASQILADGRVTDYYCTDFLHALITLLKAKGVPARLVKTFNETGATSSAAEFMLARGWHTVKFGKVMDEFAQKKVKPKIIKGTCPNEGGLTLIRGLDTREMGLASFKEYTKLTLEQRLEKIARLALKAARKHGPGAASYGKNTA